MSSRQKVRLALFAALGALLFFALGDVMGWWASERGVVSPTGWHPISHGNHQHYVPDSWTGDPPLGQFPQEPPPPGMTVGPDGQYVPLP